MQHLHNVYHVDMLILYIIYIYICIYIYNTYMNNMVYIYMIIYACRAVQHITDPLVSYSASLRMLLSRSATRGNGTDFFECSVFFCVFPWRFCSHVFDRINNFDPFLWILVSQASAVSKFHQAVPLAGQTMSWPA